MSSEPTDVTAAPPSRPRRRLPLIAFALAAAVAAGGSLYWRVRTQPVPALAPPPEAMSATAPGGLPAPVPPPAPGPEPSPPPPETADAAAQAPPTEAVPLPDTEESIAANPFDEALEPPSPQPAADDALAARITELELAVAALAERPGTAGTGSLALADVEGLVALAEQRLALARDVEGAAAALRVAVSRLAGAETRALRDALADDLATLHAFRDVDVAALAAELAACSRAALGYPLAGLPPAAVEAPPPATGGWHGLAAAIWRSLRGLVEIRDADEASDPLLNPAHAALARQQLAVDIAAARVAVLARDAGGLRAALAPAMEALARDFDVADPAAGATLARLRAIAEIDLQPALPSLARSAEALAALRRREAAP